MKKSTKQSQPTASSLGVALENAVDVLGNIKVSEKLAKQNAYCDIQDDTLIFLYEKEL